MAYAIVCFEDDSYSEVPISWLCENNTYCWWPKTKNITSFIAKNVLPDKNKWTKFKILKHEFCESLEKARKLAENRSCTDTEDEVRGRGKRKRRKITQTYDEDTTDDSSNSDSCIKRKRNLPQAPKFVYTDVDHDASQNIVPTTLSEGQMVEAIVHNDGSLHIVGEENHGNEVSLSFPLLDKPCSSRSSVHDPLPLDKPCSSRSSVHDPLPLDKSCSSRSSVHDPLPLGTPSSSRSYAHDSPLLDTPCASLKKEPNVISYFDKIMKVLVEIKMDLQEIKSNKILFHPERNNFEDIKTLLPVKTNEDYKILNNYLANEEKKVLFINYVKSIGGNGAKDYIYRVLKIIFTNEYACQCSWLGLRNNVKMEGSRTINILKEFCINILNIQQKQFETIAAEWFRHAAQRLKRQK